MFGRSGSPPISKVLRNGRRRKREIGGISTTTTKGTSWQEVHTDERMTPLHILLYTRDSSFDEVLANALLGAGAILRVARNVASALAIVCDRGEELDFAVMDFNRGCRGMTLLSALHVCRQSLPVIVVTTDRSESAVAIAYANGARVCLTKPISSARLADEIRSIGATSPDKAAASSPAVAVHTIG